LDEVDETNETNNNLLANYTTSAWETRWGSYNYSLVLMGTAVFQQWSPENLTGNIYYSDYDSVFNPSDLRPLSAAGYLASADAALGMTYFNDSISRLYDLDSNTLPDSFEDFTIAGATYAVPIIYSTNSSLFVTGLMFDSADGVTYDGTQDLVVVSKINMRQLGKYGLTDYEVRLPVRLATLKAGTNQMMRMDEIT
jgi:hypothetical protein